MAHAGELETDYLPIAEHGLVGDLHTVALVGTNGTIDWYCCPSFDSPSVFGSILDKDKGGFYALRPAAEDWDVEAALLPGHERPDHALLDRGAASARCRTSCRSTTPRWRCTAIGCMRRVVVVRGEMDFQIEVQPRFDYGRAEHEVEMHPHGVLFRSPDLTLALEGAIARTMGHDRTLERRGDGHLRALLDLHAGDSQTFVLERVPQDHIARPYSERETLAAFEATVAYWRKLGRPVALHGPLARDGAALRADAQAADLRADRRAGRRADHVAAREARRRAQLGLPLHLDPRRRVLALRAAAARLHGGGGRVHGLADRPHARVEASGRAGRCRSCTGSTAAPSCRSSSTRPGRATAARTRCGSATPPTEQRQLDIYGELIDSVYLFNKYGSPIFSETWDNVRRIVDWLCENWDQADEGIWETRGGQKDFTYSRLMCWVALERSIRMNRARGLPGDIVRWLAERDRIYNQIMQKGWSNERQAFVQHYGSDVLDASVLLMPLTLFIAPKDPRWLSTLDAIGDELVSDSLVYRYNVEASPDGLRGDEGTFSICSFWYVEALTRAGRLDEARLAFEKMLTYANHLGLYSEEIGPTGEALGNFPQAFTHLALISAAYNLDRTLG